jgi:asparagine synthase (glutamine-hydrolysing)
LSGFYGIYRYDGAPADPSWLSRMKEAMAYYGPDGESQLIAGSVGMGHLLLEVNPEDAFEKQPMRCERGLVVSAARLDNRDDLLESFKIPTSEAPQISDGHLVSLAFDRWGDELSPHLQGDWSLAAWDGRNRRLLLTRDALGNASLYYYEGRGFIAFASSLKALLALPGAAKEPDWLSLAETLVVWQHAAERTAYKGFRRLVWAHSMTVDAEGQTRTWLHWSPHGRDLLKYRRDEEYESAFLEHYGRAVRNCLRTQKAVAATLSAGRDSGSVVSLAAPLLASQERSLATYTSVPCLPADGARERQLGNEWEMAHATATMAGANVHQTAIDAADHGVIQGIEHFLDLHDGPSQAPSNHYWLQAMLEVVSKDGNGVLLTGQMGNGTVSWDGNGSAALALFQGNPAAALRVLLHAESNPWMTLKRQILRPLLKPGILTLRRMRTPPRKHWGPYSALNAQMALELDIDGRMRAAGYDPSATFSPLQDARRWLLTPAYGSGQGIWSEIGARHSLSCLDPTANIALVEFLLRVPDDQFYRKGQRMSLVKRAFRNRMPDPVLNAQWVGLQAADVGHRILRELPGFRGWLAELNASPEARAILDMQLLNKSLEDLVAKVDSSTTLKAVTILLRGLSVGIFLRCLADHRC